MSRVTPVRREDVPELEDVFKRAERALGFVPNSFFAMARVPGIMRAFSMLSREVIGVPGKLPLPLKRLVSLGELHYRLGQAAATKLGEALTTGSVATMVRISPGDEARAWDLFKRDPDKLFSYTDCTSFAVGERLRLDCAIALDEDFRAFGLTVLP